jgi:twitching motility protein PilT
MADARARGLRVLVVDDEPVVLRAHIRVLETAGHVCFGARNASEAMATLRRESIQLVVSDLRMPGDDGVVLARAIRRSFPDLPLVMVTGVADFSSVSAAREAGVVEYLVKPVTPAELLAAVERAGCLSHSGSAPTSMAPAVLPSASSAAAEVREPAIDALLRAMVHAGASDLHLSTSARPLIRKDGDMMPLDGGGAALGAEDVIRLLEPILPGKNRREFEEGRDSDFAYEIPGLSRFRGNVFMDRKGVGAVFRTVPTSLMTVEDLALPPSVLELCTLRKGLVLVTGTTGSGKSTTLAALIDHINRTRSDHIVTIEDPIEFVHENHRCLINQREVYTHTRSFKSALRAALREDPDVVLIGEMRDLETISIALETAETGHLVFGTLHTTTAASTIDRIIDQFAPERQPQVRVMLSESLKGVIAQTLCRRIGGGRVAAMEILLVNSAVSNLIREGKTFQIGSIMQVGKSSGNVTLNDALFDLVRRGVVAAEEAHARAVDKAAFGALLARYGVLLGDS